MKKITKEEFEKFNFAFKGHKQMNMKLKEELSKLEAGEMVLLEPKEWEGRTQIASALSGWNSSKKTGKIFNVRSIVNNGGWVITRIK